MKPMHYSLIKKALKLKMVVTSLMVSVALLLTACAQPRARHALHATSNGKITALKSQADLILFLDKVEAAKAKLGGQNQSYESDDTLESITVTGSRIQRSDLITNNQVSGIDEGDIIKKSGRWLIHLHAGTLSVVDSEAPNQSLAKVAQLDLASLNKGADDVWYDELLVYQQHIVVLGFDYANSASQLDFIELTAQGELRPVHRYWISSDDYFSSSNYGTRIVGDELLITLSHRLTSHANDWPMLKRDLNLPALPMVQIDDLHLPAVPLSDPYAHWVIRCKLSNSADPIQNCSGSGVIGTAEKIHYISDTAVYFACADWQPAVYEKQLFHGYVNQLNERYQRTIVYRLPHRRSDSIGAQIFKGSIGNQFQMHEFQQRFSCLQRLLRTITLRDTCKTGICKRQLSAALVHVQRS
jgi:Beta propeller domain